MKKFFLIIFSFFLIVNCTLNKVIKHHGVHFLEKKKEKLKINTTNKNDIIAILGPPSTTSDFDNSLWIYIERSTSSSKLTKLGNRKLLVNNILVLEINERGVLKEKIFLNKEDMQDINISEQFTKVSYTNQTFMYDFLSSIRQKINDPLGKR
ncbi:outer membrane protein assembly factor BamE [Candidatus Pelagibacter sp.]|nr:outer membrane protein assembly factor BamE [Candidatus Pelagibacter sp.]